MSDQFENRVEAGRLLAKKLEHFRGTDSIVLAIPRGGVPVGAEIARALKLPLDILLSKKIGHPSNPEFAIGAVSPDSVIVDEHTAVSRSYVDEKTAEIRALLNERAKLYRGNRPSPELKGKTVLLIDDGIATGNTLLILLRMLRKQNPAKIIVAVPVAPGRSADMIRKECDEFVCLLEPDYFPGVGAFYSDFRQVEDEEVVTLLRAAAVDEA